MNTETRYWVKVYRPRPGDMSRHAIVRNGHILGVYNGFLEAIRAKRVLEQRDDREREQRIADSRGGERCLSD